MAKRTKAAALPVSVKIAKRGAKAAPDIAVTTGLTKGKKYLIEIKPPGGKPVLIAVHL